MARISRRGLLGSGAAAAGAVGAAAAGRATAGPAEATPSGPLTYPFRGEHQAGIVTPARTGCTSRPST